MNSYFITLLIALCVSSASAFITYTSGWLYGLGVWTFSIILTIITDREVYPKHYKMFKYWLWWIISSIGLVGVFSNPSTSLLFTASLLTFIVFLLLTPGALPKDHPYTTMRKEYDDFRDFRKSYMREKWNDHKHEIEHKTYLENEESKKREERRKKRITDAGKEIDFLEKRSFFDRRGEYREGKEDRRIFYDEDYGN